MGFLFLILNPRSPPPRLLLPPPPHTLSHTIFHTTLSHTIFHIQLCQPPSFTIHLSHTTLSHTIFHTQLCQPPSFTHNFAWQVWHLVTSTLISPGRRGTISHPPWFCVAGVALMALGGSLGPGLVARDAAALCVAGVTWHLVTSTFISRGRRGTISHPPWFCVAGVALMALGGALGPGLVARDAAALCVAGVAWHLVTSTFVSRGRRGTISHPRSFCEADSQHFARATSYGNLQEKCRAPKVGPRLCASLRSRNALQHFRRATL